MLLTLTTAGALLLTALTLEPFPPSAALPAEPPTAARVPPSIAPRAVGPPTARRVTLARSAPIVLPPSPLLLAFARLTYRPGDGGSSQALPGPLLLVVDSGALAAHLATPGRLQRATDADAAGGGECRGDCRLTVGDSLLLPSMTTATFQNVGMPPAVVWAVTVAPTAMASPEFARTRVALGRADPPRWDPTWLPRAEVTPLAGGWAIDLNGTAVTLTLARLSLEPGAQEALLAIGTQALTVETGALTLTTEHGLVWLQHPGEGDDWLGSDTPATLLNGEGALLQAGASARLRNDGGGPLQLVALTVAAA
jgi:hypothetical protein